MSTIMTDSVQDLVSSAVAEIDRLFRAGKFKQSNEAIDQLLEAVPATSYLLFCRGRNLRYLGDLDTAAKWLEDALKLEPVFNWAHFEMAAVSLYRGAFPAAARHAFDFVSGLTPEAAAALNNIHKDVLLKSAHGSFAADRPGTARLYGRLMALDIKDYLTELRLAETLADQGKPQEADERLRELDQRRGLDPWGGLIWVRVLRALGRLDEARARAEQVLQKSQPESVLRVHACQRLLDLGAIEQVAPHVTEMSKLLATHPQHPARDLRFRYACIAGGPELASLRDELSADPAQLKRLNDSTLVDAVFALSKYGAGSDKVKNEVAAIIVAHLRDTRTYSSAIVLAMLHHHQFMGQYQDASRLLDGVSDPGILAHPDIALRRFEIMCRTNRLDQALAMYESTISKRRLTGWESAFVLRFLAEMEMDSAAVDLLETILLTGQELPRDDYLIMQVVRRSRQHQRVFAALHERMATDASADLRELQRLLVDDLCIKRGVARFLAFGQEWNVSAANRMLVRGPRLARRPRARNCAFLCTNRAYFFSALTFFASCAANSPHTMPQYDWFVFLDENVPASWEAALQTVARTADVEVTVVREREFVPSDINYMEAYGIFTGGIKLSRAAYFRIYAGIYLYGLNRYQLASYFDTDIVCQGELSAALQSDFDGKLLLARLEDLNDDVVAASRRLGSDPARYFNSGVLMLNFRAPEVLECLQRAVWYSEREPERLTFHDQCALNIAFHDRAGLLDNKLNHFLRPNKPDSIKGVEDAVMVHFLDRPKPWDVTFRLSTRKYWEPYAQEVRAVVEPDLFREIVAAANGLKLAFR